MRKHAAAAARVPAPLIRHRPGARIGLVTLGSSGPAVGEATELMAGRGLDVDWMRLRGYPFGSAVLEFLDGHDECFVVEQNRDAQLRSLLLLETAVDRERLGSVLVYGGLPISADEVVSAVLAEVGSPES